VVAAPGHLLWRTRCSRWWPHTDHFANRPDQGRRVNSHTLLSQETLQVFGQNIGNPFGAEVRDEQRKHARRKWKRRPSGGPSRLLQTRQSNDEACMRKELSVDWGPGLSASNQQAIRSDEVRLPPAPSSTAVGRAEPVRHVTRRSPASEGRQGVGPRLAPQSRVPGPKFLQPLKISGDLLARC